MIAPLSRRSKRKEQLLASIKNLHEQGHSQREIADTLGYTPHRLCQLMKEVFPKTDPTELDVRYVHDVGLVAYLHYHGVHSLSSELEPELTIVRFAFKNTSEYTRRVIEYTSFPSQAAPVDPRLFAVCMKRALAEIKHVMRTAKSYAQAV